MAVRSNCNSPLTQPSAHQAEVGRAAADVADQNQFAIAEIFARLQPARVGFAAIHA